MECPACGLAVLVEHGAISAHVRPDTMLPCDGKAPVAHKASDDAPPAHKPPAKKAPAKKAPAKKAAPAKKTAAHK